MTERARGKRSTFPVDRWIRRENPGVGTSVANLANGSGGVVD